MFKLVPLKDETSLLSLGTATAQGKAQASHEQTSPFP